MSGRGLEALFTRLQPVLWAGVCLALALPACKQEDVAPKMERPDRAAWDAPPQEKPEPPPQEKPEPPPQEAGTPGAEGKATPGPQTNDKMPPPPTGDKIPLGSPPLPPGVKGVKVKGTVIFAEFKTGLIQIDVSDRGMANGNRGAQPKVIQLFRMDKPGAFELEVPQNQGEIFLSAYNDEDKNSRPSREEPRGSASGNPFKVADKDLTGVEITLEREKIPPPP